MSEKSNAQPSFGGMPLPDTGTRPDLCAQINLNQALLGILQPCSLTRLCLPLYGPRMYTITIESPLARLPLENLHPFISTSWDKIWRETNKNTSWPLLAYGWRGATIWCLLWSGVLVIIIIKTGFVEVQICRYDDCFLKLQASVLSYPKTISNFVI